MELKAQDIARLQRWQRNFPILPRPFAIVAQEEGLTEEDLIAWTQALLDAGILSRLGAVVRPNTAGASTLAAMKVPKERLDDVAAVVSGQPEVTHNYARDHVYNLWFVVTAADRAAVQATLNRIATATGLGILDLPMEAAYHIDLGFSAPDEKGLALSPCRPVRPVRAPARAVVSDFDRLLLAAIEDGIPLVPRPYRAVAQQLNSTEERVISRLCALLEGGVITRFGYVVHHRKLGFRANAMVVWDIPDSRVDAAGKLIAADPCVTLCYRRPRRLPDWRYNLFCMIHGRERAQVLERVKALAERLAARLALPDVPHAALFSRKRYKQCGARFSAGLKMGAA